MLRIQTYINHKLKKTYIHNNLNISNFNKWPKMYQIN